MVTTCIQITICCLLNSTLVIVLDKYMQCNKLYKKKILKCLTINGNYEKRIIKDSIRLKGNIILFDIHRYLYKVTI